MARRLADPNGESNCTIRGGMKPYAEACERNQRPILEVLKIELAESVDVLEIGSGTGQHAIYFGARLPPSRLAYE